MKNISSKLLIAVVIAAAAAALAACLIIMNGKKETHIARITSCGELIREIDLDAVKEEYSFTVEYKDGGYNVITVNKGEICVSDADCRDHICMQYGWIKGSGAPIVCMPHELVISFDEETGLDAVSR